MDKDPTKSDDDKAPLGPDKATGPEKASGLTMGDVARGVLDAARGVLPSVAGIFAGPLGEKAAQAIAKAAERIFGTTDPKTIREQTADDLGKRDDLREALYQAGLVHVREQTELRVDQQYALRTQVDEARLANRMAAMSHPGLVWVPTIISMVVLFGFYGALFALIFAGDNSDPGPAGRLNTETLVYVMLGALTTSMTAVITYWLGSSAESSRQVQIMQRTLSDQLREQGPK